MVGSVRAGFQEGDVLLPKIDNVRLFSAPAESGQVVATLGKRDEMIFLGKEQVKLADLQERVRQKMENSGNKEVFLRGDSGVQYQDLMNVIDALKAAGVQNIGMVARMPSER